MNGSNPELERLRNDLGTLRQAAALDPSYGVELVWFWASVAAAGGLLTVSLVLGAGAPIAPVILTLWAAGALLLLAAIVRIVRIVRRRAERPAPWRELRSLAVAKAIGAPMVLGFLVWQYAMGASPRFVLSTLVFSMSLVTVLWSLSRWTRRWALGIALPGIALAFTLPVLPLATVPVAIAACGTAIGALSALIQLSLLRSARADR